METLLTVLVTWLSVNFALPATEDHSRVDFASVTQMEELRYAALPPSSGAKVAGSNNDLEAVYDDRSRTIYLLEG